MSEIAEKLMKEWEQFKADNDRRLKEIEKTGRGDPLTEAKIDKHAAAVGELQKQVDELQLKLQRPGSGGDDKKQEKRERFLKFMRTDGLQAKAVSVGSDPAGGYAVPETLDAMLEKYERDGSPMREACSVTSLSNENYVKLVEEGGSTSNWVGEKSTPTETDTPTLRELKPYFGILEAMPKATQQSLDDLMFDVERWLAEAVGTEFGEEENTAFTSGNGIMKPRGILGYTLSTSVDGTRTAGQVQKIASGSSGAFVADKLIDMVHALHRGYRQAAVFMMSTLSVAAIRKLKSGDVYLFQPSFLAGQPATILGYPIIENEDVPDPAADANAALFGDFKRAYTIYDVKALTVLRDPFTSAPYVKFYTTKRVGGMLVNDRAVKVMTLT